MCSLLDTIEAMKNTMAADGFTPEECHAAIEQIKGIMEGEDEISQH